MPHFLLVILLLVFSSHADYVEQDRSFWSKCRDKICSIKQTCVALLSKKRPPVLEVVQPAPIETKDVEMPAAEVMPPVTVEFKSEDILSIDAPPEILNPAKLVSIFGLKAKGRVPNGLEYQQPFISIVTAGFDSLRASRVPDDLANEFQDLDSGFSSYRQIYTIRAYISQRHRHLPLFGLAIGDQFYILNLDQNTSSPETGKRGTFSARLYGNYNENMMNPVVVAAVPNQNLRGIWVANNDFLVMRILDLPRIVR